MPEDIQKQRFMAPHSQQKRPWVFGLVVSLRNLNSPQLKVGPKENMVLFFLAGFFGSYEEEIGISHDFLTTLFSFFGEEPSQQNGSNLVANVVRKPR